MTEVPSGSVQLELERARGALTSARVLLGVGQYADAIIDAVEAILTPSPS